MEIKPTSYFASKILTFNTPLPLGISNDLPRGGYGFFSGTTQSKITSFGNYNELNDYSRSDWVNI